MGNDGAAHVGHADRLAVDVREHELVQVAGILGLAVQEHLELQWSMIQAAYGVEVVVLAHTVGHVGNRQSCGHEPLRIDFHDDLADIAPLHGHVGDVVDAADSRSQVVVGIVVQGRWIAAAGDYKGNDRKDRGRLPLDQRAGARQEIGR